MGVRRNKRNDEISTRTVQSLGRKFIDPPNAAGGRDTIPSDFVLSSMESPHPYERSRVRATAFLSPGQLT